jgi:hypothetical protein
MNFLSYLGGIPASAKEPTPTEFDRIHADHRLAMQAIKLLTESVQSSAAGNLDMTVVHEERHKDILKNMRELKKEMYHADQRHLAAFELAQRPVLRAIDLVVDKVNGLNADIHNLKTELLADREAVLVIQGTKLNAIAERLDGLAKLVAKSLIKHPEGATVAPPPKPQGGRRKGAGRKPGSKPRPLEVQYADISDRLQRSRPNSKARLMYQFRLTELRQKLGMAPIRKESK